MYLLNQICEKGILFFYSLTLFCAWHLCHYGGLEEHLVLLLSCVLGVLATSVLWFVTWRGTAETQKNKEKRRKWLKTEWFAGGLVTILFAMGLFYSITPFHGVISYKMLEYNSFQSVKLEQTQIFDTGIKGIFEDLDEAVDLPSEMYLSNQLQLSFDRDGNLQDFYTMIYGKNHHDITMSYLIEYNAEEDSKAHVHISYDPDRVYDKNMRLEPFAKIMEKADYLKQARIWMDDYDAQNFEMLYVGQRTFRTPNGLTYLKGDTDGDGIIGENCIEQLERDGGEIVSFMVSFYVPQSTIKPVRYIMDPVYHSNETLSQDTIKSLLQETEDNVDWITDHKTGIMYFLFHNSPNCWRLTVEDIGHRNRTYNLEQTTDGGDNWHTVNETPFHGKSGLAEGMVFYSPSFGFLAISDIQGGQSSLFMTTDGGVTTTEIKLPYDEVKALPKSAVKNSLSAEDYDYVTLPEKQNHELVVTALTGKNTAEGLEFRSNDAGMTWHYSGILKPDSKKTK